MKRFGVLLLVLVLSLVGCSGRLGNSSAFAIVTVSPGGQTG